MERIAKILLPLCALLAIALSILGPEMFSRYQDRSILYKIHRQAALGTGQGYRYALSSQEKIYILSEALSTQALNAQSFNAQSFNAQSFNAQAFSTQATDPQTMLGQVPGYEPLSGNYAFVVNHNRPREKEVSAQEVFAICNRELSELKQQGILPEMVLDMEELLYDAVLYSAIDVLDPRNNVAVWKLSLADIQRNVNKQNRVLDLYLDADNGKIYEFYARTQYQWRDLNPDAIMEAWSGYHGLGSPTPYAIDNPLLETASYYSKYQFAGGSEEETIVTVGFYEGINEMFLRVSR